MEWRVSKRDLTEAIERLNTEVTTDCAAMCNRIMKDVHQKLGPVQRDLISQSGLIEAQRLCIEEWEERTRKWQEDGEFLDIKLNKAIREIKGQMDALGVEDLQIEMQQFDQKLQEVADSVQTLVTGYKCHGEYRVAGTTGKESVPTMQQGQSARSPFTSLYPQGLHSGPTRTFDGLPAGNNSGWK